MHPVLRLYEDVLANDADVSLPALPRLIFVVHGSVTVADRALRDDDGLGSESAVRGKAGPGGATIWRWELTGSDDPGNAAIGAGIISREKLAVRLDTLP